jgi:hypothetical protein
LGFGAYVYRSFSRKGGNIDFQSVRPAELHSAESLRNSGQNVRWAHRPQAYVPAASRISSQAFRGEAQPQMRRQIPIAKLQYPNKFQAPTLKASASLTVPPLPACGERIACRAEAQRRREVRGFDWYAKDPHPAFSLSKGDATEERGPLPIGRQRRPLQLFNQRDHGVG